MSRIGFDLFLWNKNFESFYERLSVLGAFFIIIARELLHIILFSPNIKVS